MPKDSFSFQIEGDLDAANRTQIVLTRSISWSVRGLSINGTRSCAFEVGGKNNDEEEEELLDYGSNPKDDEVPHLILTMKRIATFKFSPKFRLLSICTAGVTRYFVLTPILLYVIFCLLVTSLSLSSFIAFNSNDVD